MLALLMALSDVTVTTPPSPQFSVNPSVVSTNSGACNSFSHTMTQSASIRISWVLTLPYSTNFVARVYQNGVLVSGDLTNLYYDKVIGQVEYGSQSSLSDWTYRVDIIRVSDGAVVASAESAAWIQQYGNCSGGNAV